MESDLKQAVIESEHQSIVSEVRKLGKENLVDKHEIMSANTNVGFALIDVNDALLRIQADKLAGRRIDTDEITAAVRAANEAWRAASNAIHGGHSPEGQE